MNLSVELYVGRLILQSVKDASFPFCQYFVNYAFEMKLNGGMLPCTCSSSNIDTV